MDKPENVLEVELPRKWIRLAFNNWFCTYLVSVYMILSGALGVGGSLLFIESLFWGRMPSTEEWLIGMLFPLLAWVFYKLCKDFFSRVLPGRIQIVGVEIVKSHDPRALIGMLGREYWFKGASIARIVGFVPFAGAPASITLRKDAAQRLNQSRFRKKNHKLLWLDEKKQIALAAENIKGGGAMLLDEDLTHLRWIGKKDRQTLLASLRKAQHIVDKDPRKLRKILRGIKAVEWENYSGKKKTKWH